MACNAALLIARSFLLQSYKQMNQYRDGQLETRQISPISQQIAGNSDPIFTKGQPTLLASAVRAGVQSDIAFEFRMLQLVGLDVITCNTNGALCKGAMDVSEVPISLPSISKFEDGTVIHFPDK